MKLDFLNKPWIKSATIPAIIGFVLSFLLVLLFGGGFPALIFKPLLSALLLATVWIAVYFLLLKFVPDMIREFSSPESQENINETQPLNTAEDFNFDLNEDKISKSVSLEESGPEAGEQPFSEDIKISDSGKSQEKVKKVKKNASSDEIMVEGVPIKKDPELMARAIQHVLDSEED